MGIIENKYKWPINGNPVDAISNWDSYRPTSDRDKIIEAYRKATEKWDTWDNVPASAVAEEYVNRKSIMNAIDTEAKINALLNIWKDIEVKEDELIAGNGIPDNSLSIDSDLVITRDNLQECITTDGLKLNKDNMHKQEKFIAWLEGFITNKDVLEQDDMEILHDRLEELNEG